MAANEPDAATGFVDGWEVNTSPGQDFTGSALQTLPTRHLLAPIHACGSALKTLGRAQASK
jgi:hypothetical protein